MAEILDGQATARAIRAELQVRCSEFKSKTGITPKLAAVLVGADPASEAYVGMKGKACGWVGMDSETCLLPATATQEEVESLIDRLNADKTVHGILVQHPVPHHLDETKILARVSVEKDVDGISRQSLGALVTGERAFVSCTPLGIMELLHRYNISIAGKKAVVVGRSIILGKPVALLLLNASATVTICHSRTSNLVEEVKQADILVAAVGRAELIKGSWIKPGAVVIDAGYNRVEGRAKDVGDVEYETAAGVASYITPVPGGVGPMTIAMLLRNTLEAAELFGV
ncbi:MAG: bifunctional methylenetetrahydrofolate dehydrogenase/methenyltetrahydrofolate cyclohydrolase FolD [Chthonomonadales bacterium]